MSPQDGAWLWGALERPPTSAAEASAHARRWLRALSSGYVTSVSDYVRLGFNRAECWIWRSDGGISLESRRVER